ncbi:hypothetical protein VPH35_001533 [Triticum aestivum]
MVWPLQAAHETDSPDTRLGACTDRPGEPRVCPPSRGFDTTTRRRIYTTTRPPLVRLLLAKEKELLPRHHPQLRRLPEAKLQKLLWPRQRPPRRGCSSRSRSQNQ